MLEGVPDLVDVNVMKKMLVNYGAEIDDSVDGELRVQMKEVASCEGDASMVQEMRASVFTMGPMLARYGKVIMPMPGGCTIGKRPIDLHLKGFRALGANVLEDEETVPDNEETEQEDPVIDKKDVEVEKVEEPNVESTPAPQPQGRKVFHPWNGMLY